MAKRNSGFAVESLKYRVGKLKSGLQAERFDISTTECSDVTAAGFGYSSWQEMSTNETTGSKNFSRSKAMKKMKEFISDDKKDEEDTLRVLESTFSFTNLVK